METLLTLPEFAKLVGYSNRTLFKLMKEGKIQPHLIRNGRNYFVESQCAILRDYQQKNTRINIGYYRVSSNSQKDQLEAQLKLLETYAASQGIILDETYKDLGSGMNFSRPNFVKIVNLILEHKVAKLIVTYEDRLCRFGYKLLELLAVKCGTEIIVINAKTTSPQQELVEDLMTIIHVFSSRLYGLRSNKKKIKEVLDDIHSKEET